MKQIIQDNSTEKTMQNIYKETTINKVHSKTVCKITTQLNISSEEFFLMPECNLSILVSYRTQSLVHPALRPSTLECLAALHSYKHMVFMTEGNSHLPGK